MLDYTDGPTMEDYGYIHEEGVPNLDDMRDQLKGVLEALYSTGDVHSMESCLDELCGLLDMTMNAGSPVMEKKGQSTMMNWYLGYQRAQLDQINWRESCSTAP